MVRAEVLSVDPGKVAEGAKFSNVSSRCAARYVGWPVKRAPVFPVVNFLFPTGRADVRFSLTLLVVRMVLGGLWLYTGISGLVSSGMAVAISVISIVIGAMLLGGLLVRVVCLVPAVYYLFIALGTSISGLDPLPVMYAILSALLCVAGPGKLSIDEILRKLLTGNLRL